MQSITVIIIVVVVVAHLRKKGPMMIIKQAKSKSIPIYPQIITQCVELNVTARLERVQNAALVVPLLLLG